MRTNYVYDFADGDMDMDMKDLLGGKRANPAEMTRLGLPVPPGFTITTETCRFYLERETTPPELDAEVDPHLRRVEQAIGRRLGDPGDPLLVPDRPVSRGSPAGCAHLRLDHPRMVTYTVPLGWNGPVLQRPHRSRTAEHAVSARRFTRARAPAGARRKTSRKG